MGRRMAKLRDRETASLYPEGELCLIISLVMLYGFMMLFFSQYATSCHKHYYRARSKAYLNSEFPRNISLIATPYHCSKDVHIVAYTHPAQLLLRKAIRETWGKDVKNFACLYFPVGVENANKAALAQEMKQYKDMILAEFSESYLNLTLKTFSVLEWVRMEKARRKKDLILVKIDSDVHPGPGLNRIIEHVQRNPDDHAIYGCMHINRPVRDCTSKRYVPPETHPHSSWPAFMSGRTYVMTSSTAVQLLGVFPWWRQINGAKPFHMEDVLFTGILRKMAHVALVNQSTITFEPVKTRWIAES